MAVSDDVAAGVSGVLDTAWDTRNGTVVPDTDDVKLKDGAVEIEATYLYADLAGSSKLAQTATNKQTGKIIRSYLNAAVRIIKHFNGQIRSFDGDRVMAIYIGDSKNTNAAKTALGINWAVQEVLDKKIQAKWPNLATNWTIDHGVGVATGSAFIVRGGVRNSNDLVSIGSAPNVGAKLSELRGQPSLYITGSVHSSMHQDARVSPDGKAMWQKRSAIVVGGAMFEVYGSTWRWKP